MVVWCTASITHCFMRHRVNLSSVYDVLFTRGLKSPARVAQTDIVPRGSGVLAGKQDAVFRRDWSISSFTLVMR